MLFQRLLPGAIALALAGCGSVGVGLRKTIPLHYAFRLSPLLPKSTRLRCPKGVRCARYLMPPFWNKLRRSLVSYCVISKVGGQATARFCHVHASDGSRFERLQTRVALGAFLPSECP
jgi:hypothetical protein